MELRNLQLSIECEFFKLFIVLLIMIICIAHRCICISSKIQQICTWVSNCRLGEKRIVVHKILFFLLVFFFYNKGILLTVFNLKYLEIIPFINCFNLTDYFLMENFI